MSIVSFFIAFEKWFLHYQKEKNRTIYIISGGEIYKEALDIVDEMLITHVKYKFNADTFFPMIDDKIWKSELLFTHEKDEKNAFSFDVRKYVKK